MGGGKRGSDFWSCVGSSLRKPIWESPLRFVFPSQVEMKAEETARHVRGPSAAMAGKRSHGLGQKGVVGSPCASFEPPIHVGGSSFLSSTLWWL